MWFMNHIFNPFMKLILRSPLHRLMSAGLLVLIYRGRKSGKTYSLPVQFAEAGRCVYLVPGNPEQKTWWRNLRGGAPVKVVLRGETLAGQADVLMGESHSVEIASALEIYYRRYPSAMRMQDIQIDADGMIPASSLQEAARNTPLVRVQLN